MTSVQEITSTFVVTVDGGSSSNMSNGSSSTKELREALENGDIPTKIHVMKTIIRLHLNGENMNSLVMTIIKFCVPSDDHTLKKLLLYFWECVEKTDAKGKLLPEMILLVSFLRNDLRHPNEYIRGITLRFLSKLTKEADILEPLIPCVLECLEHRHSYVRRAAVTACHRIFMRHSHLVPDAPITVSKLLKTEQDLTTRCNALLMMFHCASKSMLRHYIYEHAEALEAPPSFGNDSFHLILIPVLKTVLENGSPSREETAMCLSIIYALLGSKSPAVLYQGACILISLKDPPITAIEHAVRTFVSLLSGYNDLNVKRMILGHLSELVDTPWRPLLQENLLDIVRTLPHANTDLRGRIFKMVRALVTPHNVEAYVHGTLRKELMRVLHESAANRPNQSGAISGMEGSQGGNFERISRGGNPRERVEFGTSSRLVTDADTEYQSMLVDALRFCALRFRSVVVPPVFPVLMEYLTRGPVPVAEDVAHLIREALALAMLPREEVLEHLRNLLPQIPSASVLRTVLWILGTYSETEQEATKSLEALYSTIEPLPFGTDEKQDNLAPAPSSSVPTASTAIRPDGTYETRIVTGTSSVTNCSTVLNLRTHLLERTLDSYVVSALINAVVKLTLTQQLCCTVDGKSSPDEKHSIYTRRARELAQECMRLCSEVTLQEQEDTNPVLLGKPSEYEPTEPMCARHDDDALERIAFLDSVLEELTLPPSERVRKLRALHCAMVYRCRATYEKAIEKDVARLESESNENDEDTVDKTITDEHHEYLHKANVIRSVGASMFMAQVDAPVVFSCLFSGGGNSSTNTKNDVPYGVTIWEETVVNAVETNNLPLRSGGMEDKDVFLAISNDIGSAIQVEGLCTMSLHDTQIRNSGEALTQQHEALAKTLSRVIPLTNMFGNDPLYVEATIEVHQFDVLLTLLIVNLTSDTLENVVPEFTSTTNDHRFCERPQNSTLAPGASVHVHTSIKISGTETALIFCSISYSVGKKLQQQSITVNSMYLDILDHVTIPPARSPGTAAGVILPPSKSIIMSLGRHALGGSARSSHPLPVESSVGCCPSQFGRMWSAFEWENKVPIQFPMRRTPNPTGCAAAVNSMTPASPTHRSCHFDTTPEEYLLEILEKTNMSCVEWGHANDERIGNQFLCANLYAQTVFGEDALANISLERIAVSSSATAETDENAIVAWMEGYVRLRSATQGIALSLGEKILQLRSTEMNIGY